jgi:hypothetical protein
MTLSTFLKSSKSSTTTLESKRIIKRMRWLSNMQEKLAVLMKFMKSPNEGTDVLKSNRNTKRIRKISNIQEKVALLIKSMKSPNEYTDVLESNQITKQMRRLSSMQEKLAVSMKFMKSSNEGPDELTTSTNTCRSLLLKEVALEEPRSVRFGYVEIREYGRILVDHPECQDGLGLGLDWKYSQKITRLSVDCFEAIQRQRRKRKIQIEQLCTYKKKVLLRDIGGYSERELWEVLYTKFKEEKMKIENLSFLL